MSLFNIALANEMATSATPDNFQSFVGSLVPLLIFIAIFYFLLIRPQQKKQQEHEAEVAALKPNDKVLTAGGIYATVKKVKEKVLVIEIADGVEIEILADSVSLLKDDKNKAINKEKDLKTEETENKEKKTESKEKKTESKEKKTKKTTTTKAKK